MKENKNKTKKEKQKPPKPNKKLSGVICNGGIKEE